MLPGIPEANSSPVSEASAAVIESFMRDTCRVLYKYFTDLDEMLQYIENDDMEGLTVHDLK